MHAELRRNPVLSSAPHTPACLLSPVQSKLGIGGSHQLLTWPGSPATLLTTIQRKDPLVDCLPVEAHGDSAASVNSEPLERAQADALNREGTKRRAEHLAQMSSRLVLCNFLSRNKCVDALRHW